MRIAVIGPTYPYKGGISHFTTLLVKTFRKTSTVNFISWKRQYPAFLYPLEQKDTRSKQPVNTDAEFLLDFYNPLTWINAILRIKKSRSDLLILTWASPIQSPIYFVICIIAKMITKTKILYICHNVLPHENAFYDKLFIRLAFFLADSFIVHSTADKEILERLVKGKKVIKAFLPIYDFFTTEEKYDVTGIKRDLHLGKKVLMFFGYIRPYKGLKYLLTAMPEIIKMFPDISLLVVGEFWSKDKESYLELINSLAITKHVRLVNNYVPNEELGKYFSVADVIVLPYVSATQSAAIQTAYAFNKPVIATRVGGIPDVVSQYESGILIDSKSSDQIVHAVKEFYRTYSTKFNIPKIKKQFSWERYVRMIYEI